MEKLEKKIARKLKHCEDVLFRHENVKTVQQPTSSLFVGNGGLGCNLQQETLMNIFSPYGPIENIVMVPEKPYSFVLYKHMEHSQNALVSINGVKQYSGHTFYISYILTSDIPQVNFQRNIYPEGLVLLENFIKEEEEKDLLSFFKFEAVTDEKAILKHRKVKHYGYEFVYGQNNINKDAKLPEDIPDICIPHLLKLVALGHISRIPEQLTVNHYCPGQGIPAHVDTHSAFEDGIVSISLGSQVVIDFSLPSGKSLEVLLPQRSALIMLGESRYLWKHGIAPRKSDVVSSGSCLTLQHRGTRTSLTFRLIRQGECTCNYPEQCDSQQKRETFLNNHISEKAAAELEKKYVNEVYDAIASHFSETRHTPWPRVAAFLSTVPPGSFLLDIGCGNGKNLKLTQCAFEIGCDASSNLVQLCSKRGVPTVVADCRRLPFRDACADVVISIAVLHHMATSTRRMAAVKEILRILRPQGQALIYVWAFEQETQDGPSNYLKNPPHQHDVAPRDLATNGLPMHENRTPFAEQDMLVPWKEKQNVKHRFYHVFKKGELEELVEEAGAEVLDSYYDKGNWCVVIENSKKFVQ